MARNVKKGTDFYPGIDTEFDRLGDASSFSLTLMDMSDGTTVTNGGAGVFSELVKVTNSHTSTTDGASTIGDTNVTVLAGGTLAKGDSFDDGAGNLYYISSVSGNTLGLKKPLVAAIADAATLDYVGNTGLYRVECNIAAEGEYIATVSHPDYGNIALKYVVVSNTLDDSVTNNNTRFDSIDNQLSSIGASATMKAIA